MNHSPRRDRQLYPDRNADSNEHHVLAVYLLEVGGSTPAKNDYDKLPNRPQILAAFTMIDKLLKQGTVPSRFMESFVEGGTRLWEIKAPQRGKNISRLLAYREKDWDMFVAFARAKKSQQLPPDWKKTARERVRNALAEGEPL